MSAFAASLRPRAVGLVRLGVWLLALLNGARALALWPQGEWLRDLSVALDVRWRLAASLGWMVVMALAAVAFHLRPHAARRLVPLLLVAYGVLELSMMILFASTLPAALPVLLYAAFVGLAAWALWPPAASPRPSPPTVTQGCLLYTSPGHHAYRDLYGGYCYLNNAAIAAHWLAERGRRPAILDLDYHHGNGTQALFYERADVFFCSLHADPADEYPYYAGYPDEMGAGEGEGATLNVALPADTEATAYWRALNWALAAVDAVAPDALIVSLGFDTLAGDPHGGMRLSPDAFRPIGRSLAALGRPILLVQEGGYLLGALRPALLALLEGLT